MPEGACCQKKRRQKRLLLIISTFALSFGISLLIDYFAYYYFATKAAEMITIYPDDTKIYDVYDCYIENGALTITSDNPRFTLRTDGSEFCRIFISFREPLAQDTTLEVFYVPVGEGFSKQDSKKIIIDTGANEATVMIPKAKYSDVRLEFKQNVIIEGIYIGNEKKDVLPFQHNLIRLAVFFSVIFIPLFSLILLKTSNSNSRKR